MCIVSPLVVLASWAIPPSFRSSKSFIDLVNGDEEKQGVEKEVASVLFGVLCRVQALGLPSRYAGP